ncbi:unnamed protein product, partial [marine sediment metagenome]
TLQTALIAGGVAWVGAVAPDIDIGSIPGRWFGRIGFLFSSLALSWGLMSEDVRFVVAASMPGLLILFVQSFKHRGPLHKYWLPLCLSGLGYFGIFQSELVQPLIFSFAGGLCVHLWLDGIWPWSFKGWWI